MEKISARWMEVSINCLPGILPSPIAEAPIALAGVMGGEKSGVTDCDH